MAETTKQFLSLDGLKIYDAQIKKYSDDADAAILIAAKKYADSVSAPASLNWGALGEE